jgi:hypothetical protein
MRLNTTQLENLIQGAKAVDPKLYDVLKGILTGLKDINNELWPAIEQLQNDLGIVVTPSPDDVVGLSLTLPGGTLRLNWNAANYAQFYELRVGATWATASLITRTSGLQIDLNPVASGTYRYWIAALSNGGEYSENPAFIDFSIANPGTPLVTAQVIDNTVLLRWTIPTSDFTIAYYEIYRDTTKVGDVYSTFTVISETSNGTYTYKVKAYDLAGNSGSFGTITVAVNQPPDYELEDARLSTFSGTLVNCMLDGVRLLATVDLTKTYEDHFDDNSWASPAAQVAGGYPYWLTPSMTTGSYTEQIDYGTLLTNVITNISFGEDPVTGTVTVASRIRSSVDGTTWTAWSTGTSHYADSMQYVEIELAFTSTDNALKYIYSLEIRVDVKREVDSGKASVYATDAAGTIVYFNKAYKDVKSITVSVDSVIPGYVVPDFLDIPNPVSFKVFFFDNLGNRKDATIYWKARGIV